jgi:hypothetical protein
MVIILSDYPVAEGWVAHTPVDVNSLSFVGVCHITHEFVDGQVFSNDGRLVNVDAGVATTRLSIFIVTSVLA